MLVLALVLVLVLVVVLVVVTEEVAALQAATGSPASAEHAHCGGSCGFVWQHVRRTAAEYLLNDGYSVPGFKQT